MKDLLCRASPTNDPQSNGQDLNTDQHNGILCVAMCNADSGTTRGIRIGITRTRSAAKRVGWKRLLGGSLWEPRADGCFSAILRDGDDAAR